MSEKSAAARTALNTLFAAYLNPHPDFVVPIAGLAEQGWTLRRALFDDHPPEDRAAVLDPLNWFEALVREPAGSVVITVHADPIVPVPWGLLHEYGPLLDASDPYEGFWALRHEITALYSGMAPQLLRKARPGTNVRLLSGFDQVVFQRTRDHLSTAQQEFIGAFLDWPVGKAFSSRGCRERWQQVGENDCLIHFFGHASGSQLQFGEKDFLTADTFRSLFRRESRLLRARLEPIYVLSILNGCASVSGEEADSFLVATADPGFCGFIGAEARVPDQFAILFGHELLFNLMVDGLTVRQAMSRLWRKHKPMGLFYGCYAHPDFAISRRAEHTPLPPGLTGRNYHPASETVA